MKIQVKSVVKHPVQRRHLNCLGRDCDLEPADDKFDVADDEFVGSSLAIVLLRIIMGLNVSSQTLGR